MKEKETRALNELVIERLELLTLKLEIENIGMKKTALQGRLEHMQLEAVMINQKLAELDEKGPGMVSMYKERYQVLKNKLDLPEDHELDLKTGQSVVMVAPQK